MEFILGATVVIVLCIILQVDMGIVIIGIEIISGLAVALSAVVVFLEGVFIFRSEWKEAVLLRFEKKQKRKVAVYQIDGKEYKCAFPANPECMYKKDKVCKVLLNRRMSWVFDKYTLLTYVIWSVFTLIFAFAGIRIFL